MLEPVTLRTSPFAVIPTDLIDSDLLVTKDAVEAACDIAPLPVSILAKSVLCTIPFAVIPTDVIDSQLLVTSDAFVNDCDTLPVLAAITADPTLLTFPSMLASPALITRVLPDLTDPVVACTTLPLLALMDIPPDDWIFPRVTSPPECILKFPLLTYILASEYAVPLPA